MSENLKTLIDQTITDYDDDYSTPGDLYLTLLQVQKELKNK